MAATATSNSYLGVRGSCHGPSPTEGDFPRVLGCPNQCLPQSKLDVCPNAFASMDERSGIAQHLIRPSPRYRMTQTTMPEPGTSCRKVGFPLSFPRLPASPRSQTCAPHGDRQGPAMRASLIPRLCSRPCAAIKWHHVVGMANDAENIIDLYDRNAKAWDRERPRKLLERAWLERFLSLIALGGSVLDIGEPPSRSHAFSSTADLQ